MKMKVSKKWTEKKAETIIVNRPSEVLNGIYPVMLLLLVLVFYFCSVAAFIFKNKRRKKLKLRVRVKWTEQNNCGNAHHKYAIRGFDQHPTYAVADIIFFVLLLYWLFENKRNTNMKLKVIR